MFFQPIQIPGFTAGLNVEQRPYNGNNTSYKDEWLLHAIGSDVMLLSIIDSDITHDHVSCYLSVMRYLDCTQTNQYNIVTTNYFEDTFCLHQMERAKIFISRSHGGKGDGDTFLKLSSTQTDSYLSSNQIYDFNNELAHVDFSKADIMVFVGCETAYGGNQANNLATASVNAGATYSIGFEEVIQCYGANTWTVYFSKNLSLGQTVYEAAQNATEDTINDYDILDSFAVLNVDSYCIVE